MRKSPAQCFRERINARQEARHNANPELTPNHTNYELMLVQLAHHKRDLKAIQSVEKKIELKKEIINNYDAYLDGVLEAATGTSDEVLTTLLLWNIDACNYPRALQLAEYCLAHDLPTPDAHQRTMPTLVAEEFADAALKYNDIDSALLDQVQTLTANKDMPDQVRAKLHKALGYKLREQSDPVRALAEMKRAVELHEAAGVKKDIEKLERDIRNAQQNN